MRGLVTYHEMFPRRFDMPQKILSPTKIFKKGLIAIIAFLFVIIKVIKSRLLYKDKSDRNLNFFQSHKPLHLKKTLSLF